MLAERFSRMLVHYTDRNERQAVRNLSIHPIWVTPCYVT